MTNLEKLKKEMLDAKEAYDIFMSNNSRELTEEEKNYPSFSNVMCSNIMLLFELTKEKADEMRRLEQNKRDTYFAYIREYVHSKQD